MTRILQNSLFLFEVWLKVEINFNSKIKQHESKQKYIKNNTLIISKLFYFDNFYNFQNQGHGRTQILGLSPLYQFFSNMSYFKNNNLRKPHNLEAFFTLELYD